MEWEVLNFVFKNIHSTRIAFEPLRVAGSRQQQQQKVWNEIE